jgi:hypothetical protein
MKTRAPCALLSGPDPVRVVEASTFRSQEQP